MALDGLTKAIVEEVAAILRHEMAGAAVTSIHPLLLSVKQAAIYLGRSDQSVQHLIFQKDLPVVRVGRRVNLDRRDLDVWIEKNKC